MLRSLSIAHFALIDRLEIEFGRGLNVITGETGAGKSIIIDAFLAALGERTSTEMIGRGANRAIIEAVFELNEDSAVHQFLAEHDCEELGSTLILRRELSLKGNSRFFINDSPTQAATLRELGTMLVDFHGQHEHQSIVRPDFQLRMLDELAQCQKQRSAYRTCYDELRAVRKTYNELRSQELDLRAKQDFQRAQLDEILAIDPQPQEDQLLEQELSILSNAEELFAQSDAAYQLLYGTDNSARDGLVRVREHLVQLRAIDERFAASCDELESVIISVDELAKSVKHYSAHIEFQPQRIEEIRERLLVLQRLRKRYGSIERCLELKDKLQVELGFIENFEEQSAQYQQRIESLQSDLGIRATDLSKVRRAAMPKLDAAIIEHLKELGIENARFETQLQTQTASSAADADELTAIVKGKAFRAFSQGIDQIQFVASMNKGEDLKPLEKVLSGGEASRLMLALKTVLAAADHVPLVVFDEIDTGVSGRIARKVGQMMKKLGRSHQVIAITHQAQIASLGDQHLAVSKLDVEGHTRVRVNSLAVKDRVNEVAKLISGEQVTAASLKSAKELLSM